MNKTIMWQTALEILKQAEFFSDAELYVLVKLSPTAIIAAARIVAEVGKPFCMMIADKDEVTVIVPQAFATRLSGHQVSAARYRLITFDMALPLDLVGFMAVVSKTLADAGVVIFPYAAYTRDHLLVPEDQFAVAVAALEKLKE